MNGQMDSFLTSLYDQSVRQHRFSATAPEGWAAWQKELRRAFADDLGLAGLPMSSDPPLESLLESTDCAGYTRQRVQLTLCAGLSVPVYLLLPDDRHPSGAAVIACHGHGYGSRDIVGLNRDCSAKETDPGYQQDFAVALARRGFVVVAPDLIGFGDLRLQEDAKRPLEQSSCQRMACNLLMTGHTLAGLRVWQIQRLLDWLTARPDVDRARIGCMGISGGGLVCAFAAALDERIRAAVVSGYANTFKGSVMAMDHCLDNFIPGVLSHAELPDIIGLIAPRPLLVESGQEDPIFPIASTRQAIDQITAVYQATQSIDRFAYDIFPGAHRIWGETAYPWLQRWLTP
jgi:dienelactone hydrolase